MWSGQGSQRRRKNYWEKIQMEDRGTVAARLKVDWAEGWTGKERYSCLAKSLLVVLGEGSRGSKGGTD